MQNATGERGTLAVFLSAALAVLTVGCANTGDGPSADTPTSGVTSSPGGVSVRIAGIDLAISDAAAHLDRSGGGTLAMSVRNNSSVPEHLGMVATSTDGRGVLVGGSSTEGNGSLSPAGILLQPGTTVTFDTDGDGPSVELPQAQSTEARRTLPVTLQFGVAGLVHLEARVSTD
ncbi:hypothetical protein ACFVZC_32370 [Streptomyces marokkonensis]|uniref:Lipoprotein n=1 Tax=Streptomyces marokkonensis TaxID=324855 RepID=A0ABW6QFP0_9ACTN